MEGSINAEQEETLHGRAIWYNDLGQKTSSMVYENGIVNGIVETYYNDTLVTTGIYKQDEPFNGQFANFERKIYMKLISTYLNGTKVSEYFPYHNGLEKGAEVFYQLDGLNSEFPLKKVFYNRNGDVIGDVFYKADSVYPNEIVKGTLFEFNDIDGFITTILTKKNYKNGKIEGEAVYYDLDENVRALGIFKEDRPFNGFFIFRDRQEEYLNGKQIGQEIYFDYDLNVIAQVSIIDEKPFDGITIDGASKYFYEKGVLEKINYYFINTNLKDLESVIDYHDNNTSHRMWYNQEGKEIAKCLFNDGQPFEGVYYRAYQNLYETYKNGQKTVFDKIDEGDQKQ